MDKIIFTEAYTGKQIHESGSGLLPQTLSVQVNGWRCLGVAYVRNIKHVLVKRA